MDELPHVLIVDDDTRIRDLLCAYLRRNGFRATSAASAEEAREKLSRMVFDIMVLDIMMAGESGLEMMQSLRREGLDMPILLLSALAAPEDRIRGLAAGSDDYMVKPFEPEELLLRLRAMLRRGGGGSGRDGGEIRFGECVFDMASGELRRAGELVRLTGREREMLRVLAARMGQAVSRGELTPPGGGDNPRAVDVQINRLRRKIEDDPANPRHLLTIRGEGYALVSGALHGPGEAS